MANFDAIRFQPSRPLLREITADRLNAILQEIRRNRPKGEKGITVRHTGDGAMIGLAATLKKETTEAESTPRPFRVLLRVDPESDNTFFGVVPESYVYSGFNTGSASRPTGTLLNVANENDDGWIAASGVKYIWLEMDGEEGGHSIQYGSEEDFDPTGFAWDPDKPTYLESNNDPNFPEFVKARKLIAELVVVDEAITVRQYMRAHQYVADVVVNGLIGAYYFDTYGGLPPQEPE